MKQLEKPDQEQQQESAESEQQEQQPSADKKRGWFFPLFLFLMVLILVAGGSYYGWQFFLKYQRSMQSQISELQAQLAQRPTRSQIDSSIRPLQQSVGQPDDRLQALEQAQQGLTNSTEKLYELYGRDENGWKLAEVEYLMSIAQHKLVLKNDFEGAAKTLNAASERIAELADPGLLPVRVQINEEIAQLKTRVRPDLVGMTLLLSRLARQITTLKPGYQTITDNKPVETTSQQTAADPNRPIEQKVRDFLTSLITIKTTEPKAQHIEQTVVMNVSDKLEQNLKLTRWSVLERDAYQYQRLMDENVALFKEYYDLEKAENADFYESLLQLQKSQIRPELPDISGSLRLLMELQKKRENAPEQEADNG